MTIATPTPSLIERLARHLATQKACNWPDCVEDAASLLAILKDPDPAMAAAGDADMWRRMIDTALTERWSITAALDAGGGVEPTAGSDEEGEIALPPSQADDRAAWVQTDRKGQ